MRFYKQPLSKQEYDDFYALLSNYQLPSFRLGETAAAGSQHRSFKLVLSDDVKVANRDEYPELQVTLVNEQGSGVVNQTEPEKIEASAVVRTRDTETAWFLPSTIVDESPHLPALRQAFHEGAFDERDADFKYHFPNGEVIIATEADDPVSRLDEEVVITATSYMGGHFPKKFVLETADDSVLALRERAGVIRLYDDAGDGDLLFHARVGGDHPGTTLYDDEILDFISSVEYITLTDDAKNTSVSEASKEAYWGDINDIEWGDEDAECGVDDLELSQDTDDE